jgi:methyl-accepting chemotaxis protein
VPALYVLLRRLAIRPLAEAAWWRATAAGKLDSTLPARSNDEVGRLLDAMQGMRGSCRR